MQTPQTLNITVGTDVILHVTMEHEGVVLNPALIDNLQANLITGLGRKTPLETSTGIDYIVVNIPWVDGRLPGCYSLEITGSINDLAWSSVGKSIIRYTSATEIGHSTVDVSGDHYDVTMEVGYYYTDSPIEGVNVTVDDGVGTPSATPSYVRKELKIDFHNLKGNGIKSIEQTTTSTEDHGVNVVTITDDLDNATNVEIRNGGTGPQGIQGIPGEGAIWTGEGEEIMTLEQETGSAINKAMSQKAVTEELVDIGKKMGEFDVDSAYGLADRKCCMKSDGTWYWKTTSGTAKNDQYHSVIAVLPGDKLIVKATSSDLQTGWCAWLTSSYDTSTEPTSGGAIPVVSGTEIMFLAKDENHVLVVPEGAAFFCMNKSNTEGKDTAWNVWKQEDKNVGEEITHLNDKMLNDSKASLSLQTYTLVKGKQINADGSITTSANNNYKIHYLQVHAGDRIHIELSYNASGARRIYEYPTVPDVGVSPSRRFYDANTSSLATTIEIAADGYLAVYSNYTDANAVYFNLGIYQIETVAQALGEFPNIVNVPKINTSGFLLADGSFSSTPSGIYDCTDFVEVQEGDVIVYTGSVGSTGIPVAAYSASKNFIEAMIPSGDYEDEVLPVTFNGFIRACGRNGTFGNEYKMVFIHHKTDKAGAYDYMKTDIHNVSWLKGKTVAIMGDSISTNGNSGNDMNTPEMKITSEDVGVELSAYLSYRDVNNQHLSLGGHTFTSSEIGTEVTFTPVEGDVGKVIGQPANYNDNTVTTWWEVASQALGFKVIPVCWSGSSITSHEKGTATAKTSWAWHPSQIRRCGTRTPGSMERTAPDVIIIYRGTNDMTHEPYTRLTEGCFDGANYTVAADDEISNGVFGYKEGYALTIKKLREAYPFAHIVLCTLNIFKRISYAQFPTNNGINSLPEYNNAIREVADFFGCGLIEFDKDGITFENCYPTYISDSASVPTHPNDAGHKMMGRKAIADLKKYFDIDS